MCSGNALLGDLLGASRSIKNDSLSVQSTVLSKADDFVTFQKVQVFAKNSTFQKVKVVLKFSTFWKVESR